METSDPHSPRAAAIIQRSVDLTRWLFANGPTAHTFPPLPDDPEGHEVRLKQRMRHKVAASLWQIALEHHVAIVFLCQSHLRSSAFALGRSLFDAVWRGAWVAYVAEYALVEQYAKGAYDPKASTALKGLKRAFDDAPYFSSVYQQAWETLCDYNHSGSRQISRWMGEEEIAAKHSDDEVEELLKLCDQLALIVGLFTADICDSSHGPYQDKFEELFGLRPGR